MTETVPGTQGRTVALPCSENDSVRVLRLDVCHVLDSGTGPNEGLPVLTGF